MATSSGSPPEVGMKRKDLESWTLCPGLRPASDGTKSDSPRHPSLYDRHIPKMLQPATFSLGKPHYQPTDANISDPAPALDHYLQQLSPKLLKLLTKEVQIKLQWRWENNLGRIKHISAKFEDAVVDAEKRVSEVVFDLAALTLLTPSKTQVENINKWAVFAAQSSMEKETKADLLLGLHEKEKIEEDDEENSSFYNPIWPLLKDSKHEFMKYIISVECNNLVLGNPIVYLTFLLLSRLVQEGSIDPFWPEPNCNNCGEFRESHRIQFGQVSVQVPFDSDNNRSWGLEALSPQDDADLVDGEINRVIKLISCNGNDPGATAKRRNPPKTNDFYKKVQKPMEKLLKTLNAKGMLLEVMSWVNPARDIFVQAYAQLIRYDLTFSIVTSHNTSFLIQRGRKSREVIISPLQHATNKGHIMQRTVWFNDAWRDADERSKINAELWVEPYKPVAKASFTDPLPDPIMNEDDPTDADFNPDDDSSEGSDGSDEDSDNSKRPAKRQKNNTRGQASYTNDGSKPRRPPPGAGGAGTSRKGGNGGGGMSSSGTIQGSAQSSSRHTRTGSKRPRKKIDITVLPNVSCLSPFPLLYSDLANKTLASASRIPLRKICAKSTAFDRFLRVPFRAGPLGPIPFKTTTPPRRALAAFASQIRDAGKTTLAPETSSACRASAGSIASVSTVSSSSGSSSFWSSASIASLGPTAPPSSPSPSSSRGPKVVDLGLKLELINERPQTAATSATPSVPADPERNPELSPITVDRVGIILDTKIAQSTIGIVWGGEMILEGLNFRAELIRIVVKLADWELESEKKENITEDGKTILDEAKIYEHLAEEAPDSDITPHYYGVFNSDGAIALVLEDGGERLPRNGLSRLEDERKHTLFQMAEKMHDLGIYHGDLSARNILMDQDGNLRIIDFHTSELGHKCPGSKSCDELNKFANDLQLNV